MNDKYRFESSQKDESRSKQAARIELVSLCKNPSSDYDVTITVLIGCLSSHQTIVSGTMSSPWTLLTIWLKAVDPF